MFGSKKAKIRKAQKAEAKRAKKAAAKERAENSKARQLFRQYGPTVLGYRIPGFFKIHMRYAKRNFTTWAVLFVAPFVVGVMVMRQIAVTFLDTHPRDIHLFVIAFFIIALAFFFAERYRKFRKIYVLLIPALVIFYGLISLLSSSEPSTGKLVKFGLFCWLAWWLWQRAADKGYKMLSDGADKDYRPGRDLYMDGRYKEAFAHLEPAAKRGHMKSLYLLGHAHESGNGREKDRVKAARFYTRASRRGYKKATTAFDALFLTFDKDEIARFETELGAAGLHELF